MASVALERSEDGKQERKKEMMEMEGRKECGVTRGELWLYFCFRGDFFASLLIFLNNPRYSELHLYGSLINSTKKYSCNALLCPLAQDITMYSCTMKRLLKPSIFEMDEKPKDLGFPLITDR